MQTLLALLEPADYAFVVGLLESPVNLTDDRALKADLARFEATGSAESRAALDARIEKTVRYLGSADLAFWLRQAIGQAPGVSFDEIVRDVARALEVDEPQGGTLRARVEALTEAHVARTFGELPPEKQRALLRDLGVGEQQIGRFLRTSAGVFAFPLLVQAFDAFVVQGLVRNVVFGTIARLVGTRVSQGLFGLLAARMPWWLRLVGPAAWTLSIGWTVLDLQGPALRKTVPVVLYLGLVSHRARTLKAGPEKSE